MGSYSIKTKQKTPLCAFSKVYMELSAGLKTAELVLYFKLSFGFQPVI
jgi:hypothetical protein